MGDNRREQDIGRLAARSTASLIRLGGSHLGLRCGSNDRNRTLVAHKSLAQQQAGEHHQQEGSVHRQTGEPTVVPHMPVGLAELGPRLTRRNRMLL
jgi:hypothetical protein